MNHMFSYKFNLDRKYLIACSYGPDSMALLHMIMAQGIKPIVCHVDYHVRSEAEQEEKDLKVFCNNNELIMESLDARTIKIQGNFEAWAREVRYMFFQQMYAKYNAECIFVAHHQDDLIETYFLQKNRNSKVGTYGLKRLSYFRGMKVVRPLLNYTKKDLFYYCIENKIPYAIDKSNFDRKLARNRIRQDVINRLSAVDRENILNEINLENKGASKLSCLIDKRIASSDELDIRTIIAFSEIEFSETIRKFVNKTEPFVKLSKGQISEIRKLCLSAEPNLSMKLCEEKFIVKEYDILQIQGSMKCHPYSYYMNKPGKLETEEFSIDFSKGAADRNIHVHDYPLMIRSPLINDRYPIGDYVCELRRLFIDWKMPARLRNVWPIVCDCKGKIIYIPRYKKTFVDEHKSKFLIKL